MIDYTKIGDAVKYYKKLGYQEMHLPWIASQNAMNITLPKGAESMRCQIGGLVGSAEQSFLDAVIKDKIQGCYFSCTPCFRYESVIDDLHQYYFIKVELFNNIDVGKNTLIKIINDCLGFYSKYLPVEVLKTKDGYDIVDIKNKIELGSYGLREHELIGKWAYATGCAEGRLSYVISLQ